MGLIEHCNAQKNKLKLLYLHAVVVDVITHGEAISVLHTLPVWWGPLLPWSHHPILALGGWDGEVLPGICLSWDGVGLWTGRGGLILRNKRQACEKKKKYFEMVFKE